MPCGCPGEACVCYVTGDAYTGGGGGLGDPFTVENIAFAPTSPNNSVVITPGGVKNHSPGLDVRLSADVGNSLEYRADGLFGTGGAGGLAIQAFAASGSIIAGAGELVTFDSPLAAQQLTLPPAILAERYLISNLTSLGLNDGVELVSAGLDQMTADRQSTQTSFTIPPNANAYIVECFTAGLWDVREARVELTDRLPAIPIEGQRISLHWATVGHPHVATARYRGGTWVVEGSSEAEAFTDQFNATASVAFVALANPLNIALLVGGVYDVMTQAQMFVFAASSFGAMSFQALASAVLPDAQNCARSNTTAGDVGGNTEMPSNVRRVTITGPDSIDAMYRSVAAGGGTNFGYRRLSVRPVSF